MKQTLPSFLTSPFGNRGDVKDQTYKIKYENFKRDNSIKIVNTCNIEDSWYIHMKVPSESENRILYDVVIRFYTDNPNGVQRNDSLVDKRIQFFSNSPSFLYGYAYIYKREGFLIESLYGKIHNQFLSTPPKDRSKQISYDKSIYFACMFLSENRFKALLLSEVKRKEVSSYNFFKSIDSTDFKQLERNIYDDEKRLSKTKDEVRSKVKMKYLSKKHKKESTSSIKSSSIKVKPKKNITSKKKITAKMKTNKKK